MATTKAKVASLLPSFRRWKDALEEWRYMYGDYDCHKGICPSSDNLDTSWPADWNCSSTENECWNEYWYCFANEEADGYIVCKHSDSGKQFDDHYFNQDFELQSDPLISNSILCVAVTMKGRKVCQGIGGKAMEGMEDLYLL